ncbi:MAG: hypothetical protein AABY22_17605 [Nanoarchaeota archaeon]
MLNLLSRFFRKETLEEKAERIAKKRTKLKERIDGEIDEYIAESNSKYSIPGFEAVVAGNEQSLIRGVVDHITLGRNYSDFSDKIEQIRINPTINNPWKKPRYLLNILECRNKFERRISEEDMAVGDEVAVLLINGYVNRIANYTTEEAWIMK